MTSSNTIHAHQERARGCHCVKREGDEPYGDLRQGTCLTCGHQVHGAPIPSTKPFSTYRLDGDRSTFAKPTRKYRPAL